MSQEEQTLPETLKQHGYKTFKASGISEGKRLLRKIMALKSISVVSKPVVLSEVTSLLIRILNLPDGPKGENLSMRLAQETSKFIGEQTKKNKKQPFFAYLSFLCRARSYPDHGRKLELLSE